MSIKVTEEEIENAQTSKNGKESIKEKLTEVDSKYTMQDVNSYIPEKMEESEKMVFEKPTEQDTLKNATNSLEEYKSTNLSNINEKFNNKFLDIDKQVSKSKEESEASLQNLENKFDSTLKSTINSNIKKGLANSSIMENQIEDTLFAKDSSIKAQKQELDSKINTLNFEKDILQKQKETALSNFDISYAVKLADKINAINGEIAKKEEEVIKYNNGLIEAERKFALSQETQRQKYEEQVAKRNDELVKLMNSVGVIGLNKLKYQEKYDILLEYFNSMPKAEALNELNADKYYEKQLSSFYPMLYAQISNRQN